MSTPQFGRGEWAGDATGWNEMPGGFTGGGTGEDDVPDDETQAMVLDAQRQGGERCTCPAVESHQCPYAIEIHDDATTLCECCDNCTQDCADDI